MARPARRSKTFHQQRAFRSPLTARYAGQEMQELFSERTRVLWWRRLWVALAEAQRKLGLKIPARAVQTLRRRIEKIDFDVAAEYEKRFRHDVMAHLHAFADLHPPARPFLHLGATSCFVTDNADLIIFREGLHLLREALVAVLEKLADFARTWRALPTLAYTHFQPAQPTTVGKRASLWIQDLLLDLEEIDRLIDWLPLRGAKGTTGTQASFLSLFDGDHDKVKRLDQELARGLGFKRTFPVTGQTYPRKVDTRILNVLAGLAESSSKAGTDLRLLAHEREVEEPFEAGQVGSSAMPHKRNPMRSERMCGLARFLVNLARNGADTASHQWLERSLDDSSNRRMVMAEAFLCADAILRVYHSIASGLIVNETVVEANLQRELPFLCAEEILMRATREGGDRQLLHERLRVHSRAAAERLKDGSPDNDLVERLEDDPAFAAVKGELQRIVRAKARIGRAPRQVTEFLQQEVRPALRARKGRPRTRPVEELEL